MRLAYVAVMVVVLCVVPSCTTGLYVTKLAAGQARILWGSRSINELQAAGELTTDEREKLALIEDVAAYAHEAGLGPAQLGGKVWYPGAGMWS